MFTGIVEELGAYVGGAEPRPVEPSDGRFRVRARTVLEGVALGDSIAVNGCCLTVVAWQPPSGDGDGWWEADLSAETLERTNLGRLRPGDPVNLERPLRLLDRLGGHLVQGHVDAVGRIVAAAPDLVVTVPGSLARYCVEKGSITVDGVSLTIVKVGVGVDGGVDGGVDSGDASPPGGSAGDVTASFAIIPHTTAVTTLGHKGPGDPVNLEVDVMAKHAEQLLLPYLDRLGVGSSQPG